MRRERPCDEVCLMVIFGSYRSEYTRVGAVHGHPHETSTRVAPQAPGQFMTREGPLSSQVHE